MDAVPLRMPRQLAASIGPVLFPGESKASFIRQAIHELVKKRQKEALELASVRGGDHRSEQFEAQKRAERIAVENGGLVP